MTEITLPYPFPAGPANPQNRRQPTPGAQLQVSLVDPPDLIRVEMTLELGPVTRDFPGNTGRQLEVFGLAREGQAKQLDHMPGLRLSNVSDAAKKAHLVEGAKDGRRHTTARPFQFAEGDLIEVSWENNWRTGSLSLSISNGGNDRVKIEAEQLHNPGTPPTELIIGRAFEGDFPDGRGTPGAWAPLYGAKLRRLVLNGTHPFGQAEGESDRPDESDESPGDVDREAQADQLESLAQRLKDDAAKLEELAADIRGS